MRVLLDTHAFLWWVSDSPQLTPRARTTIQGADDVFLSVASCWEMAIKISLGKLQLAQPIERFVSEQLLANDFTLLSIGLDETGRTARLPFHHRDPFDRLLAAQAIEQKLVVVTADPLFRKYGVKRAW
ncbi:MAG: type II toxin-antitoxin system VapC family toxin [Vicinamibacterales bacterium]